MKNIEGIFKSIKLKERKQDGKCYFDPIRYFLVQKTPEEEVRQKTIIFLQNKLGVPIEHIRVEEPMCHVKKGLRGRADIVVYRDDKQEEPLMVIECKAPYIDVDCNIVLDQAVRYRNILGAEYIMLVNGVNAVVYQFKNGKHKEIDKVPSYQELLKSKVKIVKQSKDKMHGGVPKQELSTENVEAVTKGFSNLQKAIENMRYFNVPVLVAINKFATDTDAEIAELTRLCDDFGVPVELNECWEKGGEGGIDMAKKVVELLEGPKPTPKFVYDLEDSLEEKVNKIVKTIYGGDGVIFTDKAKKQIKQLADWGLDRLPVCMAKTQYSLSDNPALLGAPKGFTITVSDIRVANGAGFIVCRTGDVMVMPGLPKRPAALNMDIEADGTIKGLF